MTATPRLLQSALKPQSVTVQQPQEDNTDLKIQSQPPREKQGHQLACVNAKCPTFWAMLAVGKSHPPQQVHSGLRRCLHLPGDLWPIRKSGPGPKNTFKCVSPYLSKELEYSILPPKNYAEINLLGSAECFADTNCIIRKKQIYF